MAQTLILKKVRGDIWVADDAESSEWSKRLPVGHIIKGEFKKPANYKFFKKMHALVGVCYDYFSETIANREPMQYRGQTVHMSKDMFREEMTILAGYYDASYSLNGRVRLRAKSWSFGKMSEEERERMYSKLIDVALEQVFKMSIDEVLLKKMIEDILAFDG